MSRDDQSTQGVLEMHPKGYGFLRNAARNYVAQQADPYVPAPFIQKLGLREGVLLAGPVDAARKGTGPRLARVEAVEGQPPDQYRPRKFDDLTPIDPHEAIHLETTSDRLTTRVMDLLTPIGKGQRGLIVAPPRTGKTILLQHIAQAVVQNHPEMHLIMLLIDERPEEVTDMKRSIRGEVVASSADMDSSSHVRLAQLVVERGKRLAEQGKQALVLLDSLTRLARAYNKNVGNSGRTMSGGVDVRAMEIPKRLFGAARVFEEGGSLTVMGTALIETGSRMDDLIFQEFKGTGNMELVLDRRLADRRVYPAIDISQSGTRKEERILSPEVLERVTLLRRVGANETHRSDGNARQETRRHSLQCRVSGQDRRVRALIGRLSSLLLLLLLRLGIVFRDRARAGTNRRQRHVQRRQLLLPRQRRQRFKLSRLHPHVNAFLDAAAVDSLIWRHVGEIATDGDLNEMFCHRAIVGRINADPSQRRQPRLAPCVTLRILVGPVNVAADVAGRQAERTQQGDHQVGEILADAFALFQQIVHRRAGERHVACIFKAVVDITAYTKH